MIILATLFDPRPSRAAEIIKTTKKGVLVQFDPLEENFVTGDRLIAYQSGKKSALLEITKLKGNRFLSRLLYGRAAPGMTIQKFGVVTDLKPTVNSPSVESVVIRFSNAYVYRGMAMGFPYIAGGLDVVDDSFLASVLISNASAPATSEFDLFVGWAINRLNWTLTPMLAYYSFPGLHIWNCGEAMLTFTYDIFAVDVAYMPKYYDVKSTDFYAKVSSTFGLGERWKVNMHVGRSTFSKEDLVGHESYIDYKLGFLYSTPEFAAEFAWTDTDRRDLAGKVKPDGTAAVNFSKRF